MKKINAGNLFAGMRSSSVIAGLFIVLIVSIVLLFANFAYLNTQSNHDKQYIGHAGELRVLSQRIAKNATEAAAGKGEAFKLLKDARNDFEKRWNILVNGDESTSLPPSPEAVKPQMDVVQQDWDGLRKNADSILASEQTVLSLHQVASTLAETIPQLQVEYEEVVDILLENGAPADQVAVAQRQSLLAERILGSVNKVLAGDENSVQAADSFGRDASLFGRVLKGMQEGNAAMSISKVTNAEAVDRLNEIAELFEFVSGSVDEILETSPDLFQVREAANNIFSVSQTLLDKASQLAEASEHQAQEIAGASAAINEMAVSIDQVSANASESSAVAERSVAIANKGNEVVHNTITGMDNIREQIQDTSKRIKRLGESSQEIGDIVSLINDIADQTNILALNAAIQASMAGDAGRGFAVVADEVQRLAERSSAATKQIEALVKTIQTDTNEAVISMEQTTSEVVRGARLAQDAGVALEEIEKVSKTLAALIQNISNAARQQASSAGHISNTMNVIQEITSQTSAGTTATARSIGNLAKMASEMRNSVSGFKLPEGVEQA
ncbi:TPA: type IV pili methyl-accepting chemotaxis transducer N-terminal domain-containing protein [Pseudomonas aeruginosa]|nr:type IV pili methyl-accepting chemotaxis transducer N-terminal domain-containing protein [Pseudomonas aeruginosa]HCW0167445.1 type IV pili methyl-accepting chemotaxis transducer N-terminal domain-containing protein [Pseudomonas aeruginosa]HCW1039895.1 type IV pili methyl-accepting chemotaxis transducer N-terminal domain-containing protein [Pseudomonas aeruginosa]